MPLKVAPMCSKAHSFDHPEYFLFETEVDSAFFNQREGGFLSTAVSAFILTQQATVYVLCMYQCRWQVVNWVLSLVLPHSQWLFLNTISEYDDLILSWVRPKVLRKLKMAAAQSKWQKSLRQSMDPVQKVKG